MDQKTLLGIFIGLTVLFGGILMVRPGAEAPKSGWWNQSSGCFECFPKPPPQ